MPKADDEAQMPVSSARVERLISVLSLLSLGEYDPALSHIEVGEHHDRFAVLEQALIIFIEELAEARADSQSAVAKLEDSKREIEQKLETIERQQLAIRDLSTPIIELWDDILTLPIIGLVDSQRSIEMTEALLARISETGARCVIVDVTGIDTIDTMTAGHFSQMIRAAQLLGAYCVVTGLSPEIARALVAIGVDLGDVTTLRSLKEGLRHCLLHVHEHERNSAPSQAHDDHDR